jgi:hypothetical protein
MKNVPAIQITRSRRLGSRILIGIGLAAFLGCMGLAQKPGGGLELNLIQESATQFRAELRNEGAQALTLNLGTMLDNGREQYVDRIHLLLTSDKGEQLHLQMAGPAMIMGRADPLVVPLPPGATFTLPIDLRNYIAPQENVWDHLALTAGRYRLSAAYKGEGVSQASANLDMKGIALMPYWIGDVTSPELTFTLTQRMEGRTMQ